ncbi:nucleotidyltransferase [Trichlorobacter lovleyi]|uniref:putative nucleotidyltransferase substrate binding domain-containing protein n=1 Tax=Trichlorobacter lovleyi TaxID=313985 RepID=UPI002240BB0A|nr:putative nucleotidyltransferase substrate binding domain-containing protein [Trichlorobacter lovleyi]QOX78496.1 nucleotidyltransferase [Trichlorobacter lovleyi]
METVLHDDMSNLLDLLPPLTQLTRYCTVGEIAEVLQQLKADLATVRRKFEVWDAQSALQQGLIGTTDAMALKQLHDELNRIELERFIAAGSVSNLHRSCTHYRDLLAERALQIVTEEMAAAGHGAPPVSYALISMGSDGREEQTLITDQDYLIVYDDGGAEAADSWFVEFGNRLVDCLENAGFKRCTGDIMTSNPTWRGSYKQWRKRLFAIVRYEVEDFAKNMMDLIVLSDARFVGGDRVLGEKLIELIRDMEKEHFQVLWSMARAATEMKLALGFMRRLWTEPSGEHRGELNIKLLAWAPLVMNVRILAISQGMSATNTVQRINFLEQEGSFSEEMARGLRDSYNILTRHRILLQIKQIKGIQKDSYYLDPLLLDSEEREQLRHAVIRVEELQKMIHTNFNIV